MSKEAIRLMTKAHVDALSYKSFLEQERHKTVRDAVSQMHEMLRDCAPRGRDQAADRNSRMPAHSAASPDKGCRKGARTPRPFNEGHPRD